MHKVQWFHCCLFYIAGSDYQPLQNAELTIPAGSVNGFTIYQTVTIVGDDDYEESETFTIIFSAVNPNDQLEGEVIAITILDGTWHIHSI